MYKENIKTANILVISRRKRSRESTQVSEPLVTIETSFQVHCFSTSLLFIEMNFSIYCLSIVFLYALMFSTHHQVFIEKSSTSYKMIYHIYISIRERKASLSTSSNFDTIFCMNSTCITGFIAQIV